MAEDIAGWRPVRKRDDASSKTNPTPSELSPALHGCAAFPFCHPSLLELDGVRVCWLPAAAVVSADGFFLAGRGSLALFVARAASLTGSLVPCAPMYEPRSQVASARRTAAAARAAQAAQHKESTTRASSSSFHPSHGVSLRNARGGTVSSRRRPGEGGLHCRGTTTVPEGWSLSLQYDSCCSSWPWAGASWLGDLACCVSKWR